MPFELSWRPGGSVGFLIDLFGFFELTMVVVREREVMGHSTSLGDHYRAVPESEWLLLPATYAA